MDVPSQMSRVLAPTNDSGYGHGESSGLGLVNLPDLGDEWRIYEGRTRPRKII